jgi:hypothetical protein
MKRSILIISLIACTVLLAANSTPPGARRTGNRTPADTSFDGIITASSTRNGSKVYQSSYTLNELDLVLRENRNTEFVLGHSKNQRKINAYYIPGTSNLRALVIAGVHGSELSSVEVANKLLIGLLAGDQPYYSVMIIPSLFPDNAVKALTDPLQIGGLSNIGRYSDPHAVDPNRQMPSPGKALNESGVDHAGRQIEKENQLLLQLIEKFRPQRIANIHAIRDPGYGGVYADPRTDHRGIALGFKTDRFLALNIATHIKELGGNVAGNKLDKKPTALYYKDPEPAPAGQYQKRNMTGSVLNAKRGSGVSLGTWGSTAISNEAVPEKKRDAMRILTIEYPGYKRPVDYETKEQQLFHLKQVGWYAAALDKYFLGAYYLEDEASGFVRR